jgi:two-component system nitrogen regulation response regulator GlnG
MGRRVLVLEDDESLRLVISKALLRAGFEVRSTASPDTALDRMAAREADALVADVLLGRENFLERIDELARLRPDAPVIVMSAQTTAATAIRAVKSGAFEYLPKPFDLNDLVDILNRALERSDPASKPARLTDYPDLLGRSAAMQDAFRALGRLAARRDPVLILGPEGSGRAAAGRVLHRDSGVAGPLVEAGPERLAAGGFELLEAASGGTLLLRRAEDWSQHTQRQLLEVLETERSGQPRLIATAAPDIQAHLRPGLLERLAVGLIEMPALMTRGDDRALLFRHFLQEAGDGGFTLSEAGARFVNAQVWDGEVAQLRRTARRLAAQGPRGAIGADEIRQAMSGASAPGADIALADAAARFFSSAQAGGASDVFSEAQMALEAGLMSAALLAADGVRQDAARRLSMNRNTFARKLDALVEAGKLRPDGNRR